jgi:hypothetical protein
MPSAAGESRRSRLLLMMLYRVREAMQWGRRRRRRRTTKYYGVIVTFYNNLARRNIALKLYTYYPILYEATVKIAIWCSSREGICVQSLSYLLSVLLFRRFLSPEHSPPLVVPRAKGIVTFSSDIATFSFWDVPKAATRWAAVRHDILGRARSSANNDRERILYVDKEVIFKLIPV